MKSKIFSWLSIAAVVVVGVFLFCAIFSGCKAVSSEKVPEREIMTAVGEASPPLKEEMASEAPGEAVSESMEEAPSGEQIYTADLPGLDRKIIKNAYIELEIEKGKFEDILFKISNLAEQNGGFVSNSESYSDVEGKLTSGRVVIRIPHDKFSAVVDKVKSYGVVRSVQLSGQDVTEEFTDLKSRLKNLKAQEEVLLDLMRKSKSVKDSIEVQKELSRVQEEIEVIQGRINYLDNMVSYSTVDIYLHEPEPIKTTTGWGFIDALKRGLQGALRVLNGLVYFLILISPIAVLGVVIWLIVRYAIRARRRAREKRS